MSTHIVGFKPPDEKWLKMKAVYESCHEASIDPPDDVMRFFGYEDPSESGVLVNIAEAVSRST